MRKKDKGLNAELISFFLSEFFSGHGLLQKYIIASKQKDIA